MVKWLWQGTFKISSDQQCGSFSVKYDFVIFIWCLPHSFTQNRFAPLPALPSPQLPAQICIPGILLSLDEFSEAPVLVLSPGVKQQLL